MQRRGQQRLGVLALVVVLAAVAAALQHAAPGHAPLARRLPWPALAALFYITEVWVLHVQVKREAQTISLSEAPLVLGLLFCSPGALLLARVAGPALAFVLSRRQAPIKVAFNTVLQVAEVSAAIVVFEVVSGPAAFPSQRVWLACLAAVAVAAVLTGLATQLVIAVYEGSLRPRSVLHELVTYPPVAAAVGLLGLLAAYPLAADAWTALLLAVAGVVGMVCYRAYSSLSERHLSLERLYRFSHAISRTPEIEQILRNVLVQACELTRAEGAEVVFLGGADGGRVRLQLGEHGALLRAEDTDPDEVRAVHDRVVAHGEPVLLPRTVRDAPLRPYLDARGHREAVLVPLRGDAGVVGLLSVHDRLGDVRTFEEGDLQLLETVANHASVALENSRLIDQLRHDSLHDALTGLPNRVLLARRVEEELARLEHDESHGFAVMLLDLDGFKDINDTLGHQQGDELLREVARRLVQAVPRNALVARLGGDEFALLLPGLQSEDAALGQARAVLGAVRRPVQLDDLPVEIGVSIGIALAPLHSRDRSTLLKRSDVAMYAAKSARAGVRLYDTALDTASPQRLALVSDLRSGIADGQLVVYAQPKAALPDGQVHGVEALVRWQHPEQGLLGPDEFVPLAERNDLIGPLTALVLDTSLRACRAWRDAGRPLDVAVNVSTRNLLDDTLPDQVLTLLGRHGVPPSALTLEITEGSVMTDPDQTIALLHRLRALGVRLSVDDFGTGFSSLSYLQRLPVQEVKIDRSFVTHVGTRPEDATIVRSIVDLGRNLGLDVVAEGVEDQAGWDTLVRTGCGFVQGYLLSRPLPLPDLLPWLQAREAAARPAAA